MILGNLTLDGIKYVILLEDEYRQLKVAAGETVNSKDLAAIRIKILTPKPASRPKPAKAALG
jgi:hypothetical protein